MADSNRTLSAALLAAVGGTVAFGALLAARGVSAPNPGTEATDADGAENATVVLLHGLGRSATNMAVLEWRLRARGYRTCNIGYDTRVMRFDAAIDQVRAALERCPRNDDGVLHFVTHSLGGLVLRGLLERHTLPRLGRAVMLAPPNRGSEISDQLRNLTFFSKVMGPLATQLGTRPDDLPQRLPPPTIPFAVIAGDRWINPVGPLWLPAPHDGTVSVSSTRLAGMRDHMVLPYTHTFIMNAAPVARQVDAFLRRGKFVRDR